MALLDPKWVLTQDSAGNLTLTKDTPGQTTPEIILAEGETLSRTLSILADDVYKSKP